MAHFSPNDEMTVNGLALSRSLVSHVWPDALSLSGSELRGRGELPRSLSIRRNASLKGEKSEKWEPRARSLFHVPAVAVLCANLHTSHTSNAQTQELPTSTVQLQILQKTIPITPSTSPIVQTAPEH